MIVGLEINATILDFDNIRYIDGDFFKKEFINRLFDFEVYFENKEISEEKGLNLHHINLIILL